MTSNIDRFVNRMLFSIFDIGAALCYMSSFLVYWLLYRPIYSNCVIKKMLIRKIGEKEYMKRRKFSNGWSPYESPISLYRSYYQEQKISIAFFSLPISLLLNVVAIIVGNPLIRLYSTGVGLMFLIVLIILLSSWLSEYFFWKKDKHYGFIKIFMKENLIKRLAWIVGTFAALVLLTVLNIKTFYYIINVSKELCE